jgi:hypothetical protein
MSQKLIGGSDEYLPLCRKCYQESNLSILMPYIGHINVPPSKNIERTTNEYFEY